MKAKCSYPECNKDAEVRVGLNDPDAEMMSYCKECAKKVRINTLMKVFDIHSEINKQEVNKIAKLKEEAEAYQPQQTHNIAELEKVSVDLDVSDDEFETQDEQGNTKIVKQKIVMIEGVKYRIPNSVLNQLKVLLEDNPHLKNFKVKKTGQGLNTDYTVIPMMGDAPVEKVA